MLAKDAHQFTTLIAGVSYVHTSTAWFMCYCVKDSPYVGNKASFINHQKHHTNHPKIESASLTSWPDEPNNNVSSLPGVPVVNGFKCAVCGVVSGNQNRQSYLQKHHQGGINESCKAKQPLQCKVQKRGKLFYEVVEGLHLVPGQNNALSNLIADVKNITSTNISIAASTTNPYQIYFGVFDDNVFGNQLDYAALQVDTKGGPIIKY